MWDEGDSEEGGSEAGGWLQQELGQGGEQAAVEVHAEVVEEHAGAQEDDERAQGEAAWELMRAGVVDEGVVEREGAAGMAAGRQTGVGTQGKEQAVGEASGQQGGGWQVVGRKQKAVQRGLGNERGVRKGSWDGWRGQGVEVTGGAALMERAQARRVWERAAGKLERRQGRG